VLVATPIDLSRVIKLDKPSLRVTYQAEELTRPGLTDLIEKFVHEHELVPAGGSR